MILTPDSRDMGARGFAALLGHSVEKSAEPTELSNSSILPISCVILHAGLFLPVGGFLLAVCDDTFDRGGNALEIEAS